MALWLSGASPVAGFTEGAAKRLGPGPFQAAPVVQGGWANGDPSDTLAFARGTQIGNLFYTTLDGDQGSIVLWITPEWDGNDGKRHDLFENDLGDPGVISLRADSGSLVFRAGTNAITDEVSVNISGWTAGQTHLVVARWDNDNGLSGGNRLSLSVDDVHTFSSQASPPASVGALNYIGSDNTAHHPANAIIEGLTVYRRPLFDGAAGIDVGNGDEINLIYNAGSGRDPTFITGSWDVVFCLPTDSSTGPLTTGTGQAWSHPHSAELLPGNSNRGGFMLAGVPGTDGWSNEGTPTSVLPLATAEKVFTGGYKVASNAANQGLYQDIAVSPGDDWVARAVVHSDGTCQPTFLLFDQTGAGAIGSVAGTTTSTRTAPDALVLTGEAPTGSATLRVKLVNAAVSGTCFWHQVEVLANTVNNPSMQRWQATTPVLPRAWTNESMDAGAPTQEAAIVHSGTYAFRFQGGPDSDRADYSLNVGAAGDFYAIGVFSYWLGGQAPFPFFGGTPSWLMEYSSSNNFSLYLERDLNVWKHRAGVARRRASGDPTLYAGQFNLAGDFIVDDFYAYPLPAISLTASPASVTNSLENGSEFRVDGGDVMLVLGIDATTTTGTVTFNWRPRHSAAAAVAFVETSSVTGAYLVSVFGDTNNWINVYWDAANRIRMRCRSQAIITSGAWNATGAIVADTQYLIEVAYAGGFATLKVDGTTRITVPFTPANFGVAPTNVYYGSSAGGSDQGDATFSDFTTTAVKLVSFDATGLESAVELSWRTGSELNNLGFHLYRSLSESGPWTRITPSLIPGLGSSPEGASYSFRDTGLTNGVRYSYRLEDIDSESGSTFHGPVSAVPGAAPPAEDEGSGGSDGSDEGQESESSTVDSPGDVTPQTYGHPEDVSIRVISRTKQTVVVELQTPGFFATSRPEGLHVTVLGFDQPTDPRAPDLPLKRVVLDGVVGRHARIVWVKERETRSYPGLTPAAVGAAEIVSSPDGTVRPGRRAAALKGEGLLPPVAAWIPGDAFIGELKKLALEMNPIRYDTSSDTLLLAQTLRVKIAFDRKAAREESGRGSHGRRRPRSVDAGAPQVLAHLHTLKKGLHAVSFETLFPQGHQTLPLDSLR
ncbi:MAG: hypothetical protein PVJ73_18300, partial [Acidobacteriota bacterium]